jgi:hypothetical protein
VAKGEIGMIETCMMSSAAKVHVIGSKTGIRSTSALNRSNVKRGTMTTVVPIMTNLTDSILPKEGTMQEESRPFPQLEDGAMFPELQAIRNQEV